MEKTTHQKMLLEAAKHMDWQQVVLNGGPPCFHLEEDGYFCGRAERWHDHGTHDFETLDKILEEMGEK